MCPASKIPCFFAVFFKFQYYNRSVYLNLPKPKYLMVFSRYILSIPNVSGFSRQNWKNI